MNMNELNAHYSKNSQGFLKCTDKRLILLFTSDDFSMSLTEVQCVSHMRPTTQTHPSALYGVPAGAPALKPFLQQLGCSICGCSCQQSTQCFCSGVKLKHSAFCYPPFFFFLIFLAKAIAVIYGNQQLSLKLNTMQFRESSNRLMLCRKRQRNKESLQAELHFCNRVIQQRHHRYPSSPHNSAP